MTVENDASALACSNLAIYLLGKCVRVADETVADLDDDRVAAAGPGPGTGG